MSNKIKSSFVVSVLAATILTSCYRDRTVPEVAPEVTKDVSYAADVQPIFNNNCTGCHKSGGQAPDLSAANSYGALSGSDLIDLGSPANSEIYQRMAGLGSKPAMPPGGINAGNAAIVLAWIKQGAKNN